MAKAEYRSALRSRKLIKEALADILQEKPLDKITVSEVVARAGINRGTFYAHYTDIPDLINHLLHETFFRLMEGAVLEVGHLPRVPGVMLEILREILEEDMAFYRKVMASANAALLQEQLVEFVIQYFLQHEEDYLMGSREQYVMMIRFCAGGLSNLYRSWFDGQLEMSLDELTRQAQQILRSTLSALTPPQ